MPIFIGISPLGPFMRVRVHDWSSKRMMQSGEMLVVGMLSIEDLEVLCFLLCKPLMEIPSQQLAWVLTTDHSVPDWGETKHKLQMQTHKPHTRKC